MNQLERFRLKLAEIKAKGFIKTLRQGSTGIGKTLETLMGISENNSQFPDFKDLELKAIRFNSKTPITLFNFNESSWKMNQLEAIKKYGKKGRNGKMGMYYMMEIKPNNVGLFLHVEEESVEVRNIDGTILVSWQLESIKERFEKKVKKVLLVNAKYKKHDDGCEYFYFNEAKLLICNRMTKEILRSGFENEQIVINLRLHDRGTSSRNHGTAFRVFEKDLGSFYEVEEFCF